MTATGTAPVAVATESRPNGWSSYRRGAALLVAVTFAWRAWTTARWTWDFDDWVYMADTRSMSFWSYLTQDYNGHLMPGEFLVSWLVTHGAPLNFAVPVVLVSVASALSTWLWSRALATVAGERPVVLLLVALLALSPLLIRPTIWWASALQVVPLQIFMALTVLASARLAVSGARRDLGLLLLTLAGALFFWEKAVLLVIPATGVLIHLGSGSLRARVRRAAVPVAMFAVGAVAYLAAFLALTGDSPEERGSVVDFRAGRDLSTSIEFFWRGIGDLFAPAMLGGPWGTMPLPDNPFIRPPAAVAWVSTALCVAAAVWVLRRYRAGALPVLMATSYAVVSLALVLYSRRFDVLNTTAANDERYIVDAFAVAVLACAMVLGKPPRTPARPAPRHPTLLLLAGALTVSLLVGNIAAAARIGEHPGKQWVHNVTSDVERRSPVALIDTYAPARVLPPAFWVDDARLSRMLSPLSADVSFDGPAEQLWLVDDAGHLQRVTVDEGVRARRGPTADCGYALEPGDSIRVPLGRELFALDWVVQVDTFAAQGGPLTVDLGGESFTFDVGPGLAQHQFVHRGDVPSRIGLSMSPDSGTVCVTDVVVGKAATASDD